MGFNKVYSCLREVFPEVDFRILRAVALENPKDVDAAVNDVLMEVIPRFYEETNLPSQDPCLEPPFNTEVENKKKMDSVSREQMAAKEHVGLVGSGTIGGEASDVTARKSDLAHLGAASKQPVFVKNYVASDDCEQSLENTETTSLTAPAVIQEDSSKVGLNHIAPRKSNGLVHGDDECYEHKHIHLIAGHVKRLTEDVKQNKKLYDGVDGSLNDFHSHVLRDLNIALVQRLYSTKANIENSDSQIANPYFENHSPVLPEIHLCSESDYQKSNAIGTSNPSSKQECSTGEMSDIENGLMGHTIITQSGQPCKVDLLDEIIEDAKSNKITLFSAMESVIYKMRELEQKEKDVEKAKKEAAHGGLEILAKVEDVKQMVATLNGAKDMRAGDVYGEKAILATETRELQSRLLSLSDERDKSLSILDEMHTTLEARIAAVDAMLEAAQKEKLAKEERAQNALAEQEALMEKIIQETKILQQEEKENSKLREFLIDRGQIVDALQGEISVICQDVMQLKEKFDEQVPLSKSLSSSQTSCILASAGTSLKSTACNSAPFGLPPKDTPSDLAAEKGVSSNTPKEGSQVSSVYSSSTNFLEEERERNDCKAFSDDGWDVFEKDAEFAEAPYFVDAKE